MPVPVVPLDLPADQVELALIALYVFDEVASGSPLLFDQLLAEARRNYDITRPDGDLSLREGCHRTRQCPHLSPRSEALAGLYLSLPAT